MEKKKVLVFAGSNSSKSINRIFAQYVAAQLNEIDIVPIDLNNFQMPIYSEDYENKMGIPDLAYTFKKTIEQTDAIILSLAEHNGSYSAAFKNILDWTSRINRNIFQYKPMLLLATSNGKNGRNQVLKAALSTFSFLGATIMGHLSFPKFLENFNIETLTVENNTLGNDIVNLTQHFENELLGCNNYFTTSSN
ncbi:NAD(P)H-dependent oxidoreductase [Aequorivita sp. SDUM287046]|uniref:NAD(P)H-dependent oxidoreductase n=1 Tax=Aequorivita aurantiaca TaxID=3053356 RepID=A0ABT8DJ16_9FLAO|nr:NAD(P)H-dependent oxidoreductase [Aequorivita aurantiaca]MDN3725328.1 NAD(P)H-dependent oxidoreductase [Aequorivita aurantiaca]